MSISTCSLTYVVGSIMFFVGVGIGLPQLLSSPTMTADLHALVIAMIGFIIAKHMATKINEIQKIQYNNCNWFWCSKKPVIRFVTVFHIVIITLIHVSSLDY